jgi:hypothetical protein
MVSGYEDVNCIRTGPVADFPNGDDETAVSENIFLPAIVIRLWNMPYRQDSYLIILVT